MYLNVMYEPILLMHYIASGREGALLGCVVMIFGVVGVLVVFLVDVSGALGAQSGAIIYDCDG